MDGRVGAVLLILGVFELGVLALCLSAGSARKRRPRFWLRVVLSGLAIPTILGAFVGVARVGILPQAVAKTAAPFLFLLSAMALMFVPPLLYRGRGSSAGPSDSDDGGGGSGPDRPLPAPGGGGGGIPLLDGVQAAARRRDHNRPRFDPARTRRPAHPDRSPAPAPSRR